MLVRSIVVRNPDGSTRLSYERIQSNPKSSKSRSGKTRKSSTHNRNSSLIVPDYYKQDNPDLGGYDLIDSYEKDISTKRKEHPFREDGDLGF